MLNLSVERLPSDESGHNLAFIDPHVLAKAEIPTDSVVEICTKRGRKLLARVVPRTQDEGRNCLRLDRYQLQFLKPDLHEKLSLISVQADEAKRLVLEPMAPLGETLATLERELGKRFAKDRQLVCSGMLLSLKLPEFPRSVLFRVVTADPPRAKVEKTYSLPRRTPMP